MAKTKTGKKSARAVKAKAAVANAVKKKAAARATSSARATPVVKTKRAARKSGATTQPAKAKPAKKLTAAAKARRRPVARTKPTSTAKPAAKTERATPKTKLATTTPKLEAQPFPFLGSGAMPYDEIARLVIWFRDPTNVRTRADVLGALPTHFGAFGPDGTAALILETTEDLLTAFDENVAKRKQFDTSIGQALLQIHARHPIVFAARVALTEEDEHGEQPFLPDTWHAWSVTQAAKILDVIEADRDVPAAIIATALGGHLDAKNEARARAHLLARLAPLMASGHVASEDTELFAALLVDTPARDRVALVTPASARIRISIANEHGDLFLDFVDAPDAMAVIEHLADTKTDDAWTDDTATETARANAHRVRWLVDRLTSLAITEEKRKDRALEIAEAAISVANELSPQGESWTASRMLTVKSLQTELDLALPYLNAAAQDKDGAHAIGTALAVAAKHSHRPMIDACIAIALRNPEIVKDRVVVANLLGELVGKNRFEDATKIALLYLEHARYDDGSWGTSALTPALVTSMMLAFARTNECGPLASAFQAFAARPRDLSDRRTAPGSRGVPRPHR